MRNILEALNYMHQNKVVHRDLKPANLILESKENDWDIRIADFGFATFIKEGEPLTLRCGSPGYQAPELLEGDGYDEKADMFSVGTILYVLLSGEPTFKGFRLATIMESNRKCVVEYPDKYWSMVSDDAKDLVERLLEKDPKHRISAAQALEHEWLNKIESLMSLNNLSLSNASHRLEEQDKLLINYKIKSGEIESELQLYTATPI